MKVSRVMQRSIPLAAIALVGASSIALAQGQEIFEWQGRVDRGIQISMRGRQLGTRDLGDNETGRARSRVFMQVPRRDGQVMVQLLNGRGQARIIQQPSARNGYTLTVQIEDPARGADDYRLAAYWQAYSGNDGYGNNRDVYGNSRDVNGNTRYDPNGRARDGRDDRMDRRDRNDRDDHDRDRSRPGNGGYDNGRGNGNNGNNNVGNNANGMLHWSGNVDDELELRIQNGRVDYRTLSGAQPTNVRADRGNIAMPRNAQQIAVVQNQGRGTVTVVEQPSSYNGYTTVLRIRDPQGGYGFYDFDLLWR